MSVFQNFNKMAQQSSSVQVIFPCFLAIYLLSFLIFSLDYISEVLNEEDTEPKSIQEWDSPITFTAKSSREYQTLIYNYFSIGWLSAFAYFYEKYASVYYLFLATSVYY